MKERGYWVGYKRRTDYDSEATLPENRSQVVLGLTLQQMQDVMGLHALASPGPWVNCHITVTRSNGSYRFQYILDLK